MNERRSKCDSRALELVMPKVCGEAHGELSVGVQGRIGNGAILIVDDGKAGGDDLRIRMFVEGAENLLNFVWGPEIVLVGEEKDIAGGGADGLVKGFDDAMVVGMAEQKNAGRVHRIGKSLHEPGDERGCIVHGSIVDDDDFVAAFELGKDGSQLREDVLFAVAGGHADGDFWPGGRSDGIGYSAKALFGGLPPSGDAGCS